MAIQLNQLLSTLGLTKFQSKELMLELTNLC